MFDFINKIYNEDCLDGIKKIDDNYKKIVVSMDDFGGGNVSGIEQWNVVDFLCDFLG